MILTDKIQENKAAFIAKVIEVSNYLGIKADWLMFVMYNESGLNHRAVNPNGGATGLIQFMPATAAHLGTSTAALRSMSNVQQLEYVKKYFERKRGQFSSVYDLYLYTFFPIAVGKPDNWVLQTSSLPASLVARSNKPTDLNNDNQITVGEFKKYVRLKIERKFGKKEARRILKPYFNLYLGIIIALFIFLILYYYKNQQKVNTTYKSLKTKLTQHLIKVKHQIKAYRKQSGSPPEAHRKQ